MCRACWETPDNQGRRCPRDDGFSGVEGEQRNRSRGLNNAADALAQGDAQSAVNQLENARRAQRSLDGVPSAPVAAPQSVAGPQRDIAISPSSVEAAEAQLEQLNRAREAQGYDPLRVEITRQTEPDAGDPIMVWERATVRVAGASQEELDALRLSGVSEGPERRVKTAAVLEASCAITRVDSDGRYVSRKEGGEQSTPARVSQYLGDSPDGPLRQRYAPTTADQARAHGVRVWARQTRPTNDYLRAMRHSLAEAQLGPREVGTAASALAGYERAYADKTRAEQKRDELLALYGQEPASSANGADSGLGGATSAVPGGQSSRWLNKPGDKVMVTGRVERVVSVFHENRRDPRHLYIVRTPDGDAVKWLPADFTGFKEGDDVTLRGQVKTHSTFNGEKQTEMFYCKPEIHAPSE